MTQTLAKITWSKLCTSSHSWQPKDA